MSKEIYYKLCETKPEIPVFAQPWWLDEVCKSWDVAIAKKGELITGVWPYPVEKKIGVQLLRTPKLTPYLGPVVFFPSDLKESNLDNFEHETVTELLKQVPESKVWNLAMPPHLKQAGLFKNNHLTPQVQQTFILELKEDEQTLFNNMKDSTRRNVRMAEDEVIISNSPEYLKQLYQFQKQTLEKKGKSLAYSLKDMQQLMKVCQKNNACTLWVAKGKNDHKLHGIVWQVWDKQTSYYFMGAQAPGANNYRSMSLLLWNTIKEAKKMGNSYFDLEGSMDEGVERFFRNFGGDRVLYMVLHKNKSLLWKLKQLVFK